MFDDFDTQIQNDELFNPIHSRPVPYFDRPTRVKFADGEDMDIYIGGIAYCDEIICGCCGALISIEDLFEVADEKGIPADKIIITMPWTDISEAILGD